MSANKHTDETQAGSADIQVDCAQVNASQLNDKQPCLKHADGAQAGKCCCHYKETERTEKLQVDVKKRLNRAIGQLNGVKNMIDNNRYCGDVLTQLAAAESAVHSAAEMILRDHLETCVKDRIRQGDDEIIEEAMRLIKKFARS
jgi:DNA-binding FrmR family transcriptional regulator